MQLRTLYKADIPQILAIEKSVHVVPWTEETFKMCFRSGYFSWGIEHEGKVIGFIIISLSKEECHVLNLCVALDHQHQGLGRKMLKYALSHAKQNGVGIAYLEVRRSNSRAISLYRKMNFHLVGERKNYYPTIAGNEDALIFAMSLHLPLEDV
jgi:ribosomal-protein-alanine N-acetyltransferase